MKITKLFIKKSNIILASLLTLFGFNSCEQPLVEYGVPNADCAVKGKVLDKTTLLPIKGVRVGFNSNEPILMYGVMPTPFQRSNAADTTNLQGEYELSDKFSIEAIPDGEIPVFVQDIDGAENGSYRDTVLNVNFKDAERSGKTNDWYNGKYTVNLNIELKKKQEGK